MKGWKKLLLSKTHIVVGGAFSTTFTTLLNIALKETQYNNMLPLNNLAIITGSLLGAILPDIDHCESWVSQTIPIKFYKIFKHRGITHNPLNILFFIAIAIYLKNYFLLGLAIGIFSHLAADFQYSSTKNKFLKAQIEKVWFVFSWIVIAVTIILNIWRKI